jgi:hypothetical protein
VPRVQVEGACGGEREVVEPDNTLIYLSVNPSYRQGSTKAVEKSVDKICDRRVTAPESARFGGMIRN